MTGQNRWVREAPKQTGPQNETDWLEMPLVTQLEVVYRTDPEVYRDVVPPPLEASPDALVHVRVSDLELPAGEGTARERIGYIALEASYKGEQGEYPLVMPLDLEPAVSPSRERFGEPKKLAQVQIERQGDHIEARVARGGVTFIEIAGEVKETLPNPAPYHHNEWWIKYSPSVRGEGFDAGPWLVRAHSDQTVDSLERIEGKLELRDLASDPIVDLPVREVLGMQWKVYHGRHKVEIVTEIDGASFLPYVHSRYDF